MILFEFLLHHYTYFVAGISRYDTCIPKYLAIDEGFALFVTYRNY